MVSQKQIADKRRALKRELTAAEVRVRRLRVKRDTTRQDWISKLEEKEKAVQEANRRLEGFNEQVKDFSGVLSKDREKSRREALTTKVSEAMDARSEVQDQGNEEVQGLSEELAKAENALHDAQKALWGFEEVHGAKEDEDDAP